MSSDYLVQFRTLSEVSHSTGASTWAPIHLLPPCYISEVSITTTAAYEKQEVTEKPMIIPMGIQSCVCQISGTFESETLVQTGQEISNEDILNTTANNGTSRIAIEVVLNLNKYPELSGKWAITAFTWDRNAKELGRYTFQMELSYIWSNPAETQLYHKSTGTSIPSKISFICDSDAGQLNIFDVKIHESLNDINTALFSTLNQKLEKNSFVQIFLTNGTTSIFSGYVINVSDGRDGVYKHECVELGKCLYDIPVVNTKGGLFKPRAVIHNPISGKGYLKIQEYVSLILSFYESHPKFSFYQPGSGVCRARSLSGSTEIPGQPAKLPPVLLSGTYIGKALDDFLENICGFHVWFDRQSGRVEYGFIRDKIVINPKNEIILSTVKMNDTNALDYIPDRVFVWSNDGVEWGCYPRSQLASGKHTQMSFKLSTNAFTGGLDAFAKKIYDDAHVTTDIFRVTFPPGTIRFKEGDYFDGLGDQTVSYPMEYKYGDDADPLTNPRDSVWKITDVIITEKGTDVIVGPSYYSVFDIYRTSLSPVSTVPAVTETITDESNNYVTKPSGQRSGG